jgi:hypothetical protein
MSIQGAHHTNPGQHSWPAALGDQQRFRKKSSLGARQQPVGDGENGRQSSRDSRPSTPPALLVNHEEHGFGIIIKTAL